MRANRRVGVYGRQSRGKTKSVDEQIRECSADVAREGDHVVGVYTDLVSASRYSGKQRGDYTRLLADVAGGALDVVATWSPDRADRTLTTWSAFLDACREHKVLIRVTDHERTYDMSNPRDWRQLAEDGIDAAYFSEKLSRSVLRGVAGAARSGRPPMGPCPFGYRRVYDPSTGDLVGQELDPEKAPVVERIFDELSRGVPLVRIAAGLDADGVPPPGARSRKWYRMRIREIALNPVYIGKRRHRATGRNATTNPEVYEAAWPALVDEATYWLTHRLLNQPGRLAKARPGRQKHLLTYLATCYRGHPVRAQAAAYTCGLGCVWIKREPVDRFVREAMIRYLSRDAIYQQLRQVGDDADKQAVAAEAEVARLTGELHEWRLSAARGTTTRETMAVVEEELTQRIRQAEQRARNVCVAPGLWALLEPGGDLAGRWDVAELAARRGLIRSLMVVELHPAGRDATVPVHERVRLTPR